MICKECEVCNNYKVCENGCFGNTKPCEYLSTDTDEINYCPKCGTKIKKFIDDGTAICESCSYHFRVVESDKEY